MASAWDRARTPSAVHLAVRRTSSLITAAGSPAQVSSLSGIVNQDEILSNSIHDNAGLGINLGNGPTPNHPPGSFGPNNYQNYPVFSEAKTDGTTTTVTGTFTGLSQSSYTVQVFSNVHPDPSGYGEGQSLLGTYPASTDSNGKSSFTSEHPLQRSGWFLHFGDRDRRPGKHLRVLAGDACSGRDRPCCGHRGDTRPGGNRRKNHLHGQCDQQRAA